MASTAIGLLNGADMATRSEAEWQQGVQQIQQSRQQQRQQWLQQIAVDQLAPTRGAQLVQLASKWERSAELVKALQVGS